MRRLIYICLAVAILPWIVIGIVREATDDDTAQHYFVRAIFDNAANLTQGEDVKIAGVPVGVVSDLNVTDDKKAAVTLRIDDEDFTPWKTDASCTIRPQGLIGEKFVECEPGSSSAQPLSKIASGDGKGERLLAVAHTSSPVDIDLLNDILRLPYRQRLAILLSEFGTGLAGRGADLNTVIHRANPALRQTDKLLAVLVKQNKVLAELSRNSDEALGPLARERDKVADWIVKANETGQASAERRGDITRGIDLLPATLRQLKPTMADLDKVAKQGEPLLADIKAADASMGPLIKNLGTVSEAGRKSFPSLGDALERGRPALIRARPLIRDLRALGKQAAPATDSLDKLTASLQETNGLQRIDDFVYYLTTATNGFDSVGHYLRAGLVTNACSGYFTRSATGCNSKFYDPFGASAASATTASASLSKGRGSQSSVSPQGTLLQNLIGSANQPGQTQERNQGLKRLRQRGATRSPALRGSDEPLLDYLLGSGR